MKCTTKKLPPIVRQNLLTIFTLAGVIMGVVLGISLRTREEAYTARESMYVKFLGTLFIQMLKAIIIPLIIPSLIVAVGSLDLSLSGKVGARGVAYYLTTTLCAVILGIILVTSIRPGVGTTPSADTDGAQKRNITTADTLMDLVRNLFPPNIIQAATHQMKTELVYPASNGGPDPSDKSTWAFRTVFAMNTNILGLVVFSLVFGIAIACVGDDAQPILDFFASFVAIMMKITGWVINLAPVGVFFLVAGQILAMESVASVFSGLGWYFATVVIGLLIHGAIVLPLIYGLLTRTLPFKFIGNMGNAIATAFGTASSSATLPVTIEALETRNGIDPRITRFILPIGATINMDGTALYEAVAAIFIAQVRNVDLTVGNVIAISITATAASIGAAGIPQAGLVTMVMVLDTIGLPSTDIALILAVDWLLDRFRTAINVLGDALGAGIVHHLSRKDLAEMDQAAVENPAEDRSNEIKLVEKPQNGTSNPAYEEKSET